MTNLWLAVLSTVLTLVILTGAYYIVRWHFNKLRSGIIDCFTKLDDRVEATERSLRSHVVDEIDHAEQSFHARFDGVKEILGSTEKSIINFVKEHADDLRKHAAEIKAHSIEIHDRAVSRDIAPRQAVTRT